MIKILKYNNTSVEVSEPNEYNAHEIVAKERLIEVINLKLNHAPPKDRLGQRSRQLEDIAILSHIVFEYNDLEQYIECTDHHNSILVLNFVKDGFVSLYSITFKNNVHSNFLDPFAKVRLSDVLADSDTLIASKKKAPILSLKEIRQNHLPLFFFNLSNGRLLNGNTVYNEKNCLPVNELIKEATDNKIIEQGDITFEAKYDESKFELQFQIKCHSPSYKRWSTEFNYEGHIDLNTFTLVIAKVESEPSGWA